MDAAGQKTILIAEDEQDLSSALEMVLVDAGYRVTVTGDGMAAMEEFMSERPDMVLLDIHMPKMNGIEVLTRIRQLEDGKNVPVTVLTATDTMGAISDVTTIGGPMTDFFGKADSSLDQIVEHVRARLG